ncbi:MAG: Zn-ribbon domain-containing OB-fold protein [Halobacteriota archaeon]
MTVARFWRKIPNRYNLIGTKCENCNTYYFPPRLVCPPCRRNGIIHEHQFEGTGTVITYSTVYSAPEGFTKLTPYVLAIVQLDEGPRLTAQIVCDPSEIDIGMRVRSVFRKLGEEGADGVIYYGTKFVPM